MPTQLDLFNQADSLRDAGMQSAKDHANQENPSWHDQALQWVLDYATTHATFSGEKARQASAGVVPEPPHLRAWGSVLMAAAKRKWIKKIGYVQVKNPLAHRANAALWQSCVRGWD